MTALNYAKLVKQTVVEETVKSVIKDNEQGKILPRRACAAYNVYTKKNKINFESYK